MDRIFKCGCIGFVLACNVFAVSCNHKQEVTNATSQIEKETEKISTVTVENFDAFFERFSKDSVFQKSRIKFPLKTSYHEDPTEGEIVHYLKDSSETEYIDFTGDSLAMNKETDKFAPKVEKTAKGMVYKRIGYDNGIYISYIFILSDNSWFLSEILDEST